MKKIVICLLCLCLLCGCNAQSVKNDNKITVVTTIFPLYDFARAIGGERLDLQMLIKAGNEVHSYDPLPSDMMSVYNSDLFLYIGGESDAWVDSLLDNTSINSVSLIDCVSCVSDQHIHHTHNHADEHIWTSPNNAVLMLETICQELIAIDPDYSEIYKKNCEDYIKKINSASKEIEELVSKTKTPFIVVADRFPFGYFTEQYDIDYEAAFDGCAVSSDISLKTMARITKTIKERNIGTVFCTELSNQSIAKALNEELGVEVLELHSAHNVTLDDFNSGITYVDILNRNKNVLERGIF